MRRLPLAFVFPLLSLACAPLLGCATYDGPPEPSIEGLENGVLTDATVPLVVSFSEPIQPDTLTLQIVRYVTDAEGNLGDEDTNPDTDLDLLFLYEPDASMVGGKAELLDNNTRVKITPDAPFPIGPKLALLIEPKLSDLAGNVTNVRRRLLFGYTFKLDCEKPSLAFPTGAYFLLADIDSPIQVQVQLWADFEVDPMTGRVRGQCTSADRNTDPSRCPMPCEKGKVCRLYPMPACVLPSERAGTSDEFDDFVPNHIPPTGFSFTLDGCAVDQQDGSAALVTAPTDVVVQSPPVTLRNVTMTAQFTKADDGVLRGSGSLAADSVLLGTSSSGKGQGALTGQLVPPDKAPPDIPKPPPASP